MDDSIGVIVGGSLSGGITAKLQNGCSVEDINVGRYVTIQGKQKKFMGMVTDVGLQVTDTQLTMSPPDSDDDFSAKILNGIGAYGTASITPYLLIADSSRGNLEDPEPVKTIPSHFSKVRMSTDAEFEQVFGSEKVKKSMFSIGNPLDMEYKLCLDIPKLVERSNGIFGKSGTGKSYFTRLLLGAMIQKSQGVNLIFDMHNEYGHTATNEEHGHVKGLKQFFPEKVATLSLGRSNTPHDGEILIDLEDIEPEDFSILGRTLNMTDLAVSATYAFRRRFGKNWIEEVLRLSEPADDEDSEKEDILKADVVAQGSFENLVRALKKIKAMDYINKSGAKSNIVDEIMSRLLMGVNVIIEFGRHSDVLTYMLVSNLLARRIYDRYRDLTEKAISSNGQKPTQLVITIEEAHNFLNESLAQNSIFGIIAREMRKYCVTLLVIDQRPSGIQEEILSQLGTKVIFLMDNDRDIDAALSGTSGKTALRAIVAKLASKRQALIFGHALPMPVAFTPREYNDSTFYRDKDKDESFDDLFPEDEE